LIFKPVYLLTIYHTIKKAGPLLWLTTSLLLMSACKNSASEKEALPKYSLHLMDRDDREYIVQTNDLGSGVIDPEQVSEPLPDTISRNIIIKDGFYYQVQRRSGIFIKYQVDNKRLRPIAQLPLSDYGEENFYWIGKDSLLLSGLNLATNAGRYYLIHTADMKVLASGALDITQPQGIYKTISIGLVQQRKDTLLVGYTFHPAEDNSHNMSSDTMYIASLLFPSMQRVALQKDWRSTYPAGPNNVQHNDFTDEQGNYYFMTCPGIAMGNQFSKPTAIFRIKANETQIDPGYFFSISGSVIGNHAYGLWSLGNGKAIVRTERKDLYKGLSDHYSTPHFEFYLLDVSKQQVIKKLPLPLDKGTRKECILVEGNTAYIAVNSRKDGNYIWKYDIQKDELTKGLRFSGTTDFILRIDRLNR